MAVVLAGLIAALLAGEHPLWLKLPLLAILAAGFAREVAALAWPIRK